MPPTNSLLKACYLQKFAIARSFLRSVFGPRRLRVSQSDPRLAKASARPELNGWIFVHLEGTPSEIGFQHGYLLAPEIEDAQKVIALGLTHDSRKPYGSSARPPRRCCGRAWSRSIATS
jgi:hypothetical protein